MYDDLDVWTAGNGKLARYAVTFVTSVLISFIILSYFISLTDDFSTSLSHVDRGRVSELIQHAEELGKTAAGNTRNALSSFSQTTQASSVVSTIQSIFPDMEVDRLYQLKLGLQNQQQALFEYIKRRYPDWENEHGILEDDDDAPPIF
jgi:hypothetical protein